MSDTSYEKEKPKGKPGQQLTCLGCVILLIKVALLVIVGGHLIVCAFFAFVLVADFFRSPYFSSTDVDATCSFLELPRESDFCQNRNDQTIHTLDVIFEEMYPLSDTTVAGLETKFAKKFDCQNSTFCSLRLPMQFVDITMIRAQDGEHFLEYRAHDIRND